MSETRELRRLGRAARNALALFVVLSCGKDSPTQPKTPPRPASLTIVSGDGQQATVGTQLPAPVVVQVLDDRGRPLAGQLVNFRIASGGGSVFAGSALSDDNGVAKELWTLGTSTAAADSQRLEARAVDSQTGEGIVFARFRAVALPGAPAELRAVAGNHQAGEAGAPLPDSLVALLTDRFGNATPGDTIRWNASAGAIAPGLVLTDSAGRAAARWTLGPRIDSAGVVTATFAAATPLTTTFDASARVPSTALLVVVRGDAQQDTAGAILADSAAVRLTLTDGRAVRGAMVTWVASAGAAAPTTSITDADGRTATQWQLGTAAGSQTLRAIVGADTATFHAVATPLAATLSYVRGTNQTGYLGAALADSLVVGLRDARGNPVPGDTIVWSTNDGSTVSAPVTITATDGSAAVRWTLGASLRVAPAATATYTRGALTRMVRFVASASIPPTASFVKVAGDQQTDSVGALLRDSLLVRLTLADGRGVDGARIRWTPSADGTVRDTATFTDSSGRTATRWRLGTARGAQSLTARSDIGSVIFAATALGPAPVRIAIIAGRAQAALPGNAVAQPVVAQVVDSGGSPLAGEAVTFAATTGSGTLSATTVTTDASGRASTTWTLGPQPGDNIVTASAAKKSAQAYGSGALRWTQLAIGTAASCGMSADAVAYCWGDGLYGGLGNGLSDPIGAPPRMPRPVTGGLALVRVSAGGYHGCGLTSDGSAYCWGDNYYGSLGTGDTVSSASPRAVVGGLHFRTISAGSYVTCGVTLDNVGYCWGGEIESRGTLGAPAPSFCPYRGGTGGMPCALTPIPISGGLAFDTIAVGQETACGITTTRAAYCWGFGYGGQLGNGSNNDSATPVAVAGGYSFRSITLQAGSDFGVCGLLADGSAVCWGDPFVENRDRTLTNRPESYAPGITFATLSLGGGFACGSTASNATYCWGLDRSDQLGQAIPGGSSPCRATTAANGPCTLTPLLVGSYRSVSAAGSAACALDSAGQAFCWGGNYGAIAIFGDYSGAANLPTPLRGPDSFPPTP